MKLKVLGKIGESPADVRRSEVGRPNFTPLSKENMEDNALFELDTWKDIVSSDGWKLFKDLLDEHRKHLEWQVIISVGNKKFEDASDYCSRASECKKILQLVDGRLAELRKEESKADERK